MFMFNLSCTVYILNNTGMPLAWFKQKKLHFYTLECRLAWFIQINTELLHTGMPLSLI